MEAILAGVLAGGLGLLLLLTWLLGVPVKYNVRNLRVRWVTSLLTILGIALVTVVFVMLFAMGLGIERSLVGSGDPLNLITLRAGTTAESQSVVTKAQYDDLLGIPGLLRDAKGEVMASPELVVGANVQKQDGGKANVAIRGVGPKARDLRTEFKLSEGRWFNPSVGEVVVGVGASRRFRGLQIGDSPTFRGRQWRVVGKFECGGQAYESELWGDIDDVKAQFKRDYSGVLIRCANASEVKRLSNLIQGDKQFKMDARPTVDYFSEQNIGGQMIKSFGVILAVVLGIGAVFGAANTMYAAVASRTREIATMRVLGFSRLAIWTSFVLESAVLGLVGGSIGAVAGYALFNNMSTGTVNWISFSELAFQFRVTLELMETGAILATVMGVVGGFFPAFRASRMTIARALRGL
ncbi:MAG TPA: ABC transporter permease [Planctomycetota bacterium]|nr:ABC transporter permease [Planctomycetota bacterium]